MATKTEGKNTAEFLLTEGPGWISRENIVLDSTAGAMVPGTLLGKMANGRYKAYANANSAGDADAVAGILYAAAPDLAVNQKAVMIAHVAEVQETMLTGLDSTGRADLAALGIILRANVPLA